MKLKERMKKEQGITLVALIITIIVLIILAAVSIIAVTKTNFIEVALNSSVKYAEKQREEMNEMDYVDNLMGNTVERIQNNQGNQNPSGTENEGEGETPELTEIWLTQFLK